MLASIELQVISKLLISEDQSEIDHLLSYNDGYYSIYTEQIRFIRKHFQLYSKTPDVFTFQSEFPDIDLVQVNESLEYIDGKMKQNRQRILLIETFNKINDLDSDDVSEAWKYIGNQYEKASELQSCQPMDIIHEAKGRSDQIVEFSKQRRIPTGFKEIDDLMYGGLSTVEEMLVIIARTNSGKTWLCTKMMETAHEHNFPVLYYSPEMQGAYLATRFDTWRKHFKNNELFTGKYSKEYLDYIDDLEKEETPAIILEDKDIPDGVSVKSIIPLIRQYKIKLLIIDGLSYMKDDYNSMKDYEKYKNICSDLFSLSKQYGCAVVIAMQANRATLESRDANGEPFPSIYNAEGSDHPARIATQVFSIRQIFETHTLDIRLEKTRNAANVKPVLSYVWDVNTGRVQYMPNSDSSAGIDLNEAPQYTQQTIINTSNTPSSGSVFDQMYLEGGSGLSGLASTDTEF